MAYTSKTLQLIHIYFTTLNKPPDGFCTHLFFASEIVLIFGGLFFYGIFRIFKFKIKWLRATTNDFIQKVLKLMPVIATGTEVFVDTMTIFLSNYYDALEETITHTKSLKLKIYPGENVTD